MYGILNPNQLEEQKLTQKITLMSAASRASFKLQQEMYYLRHTSVAEKSKGGTGDHINGAFGLLEKCHWDPKIATVCENLLASFGSAVDEQFISAHLIFMHGLLLAHVDDAGMVSKDLSQGDCYGC